MNFYLSAKHYKIGRNDPYSYRPNIFVHVLDLNGFRKDLLTFYVGFYLNEVRLNKDVWLLTKIYAFLN